MLGATMQTTVRREISLAGMGLHSGRPARLVLRPSDAGGIRFHRVDITDRDNMIPARYDLVNDTTLCTRLTNEAGASVSTVEHLMAALAGLGVTHVDIDIDGPEVPIMDGSSYRFVKAILKTGLRPIDRPVRALRVLKTVRYEDGPIVAELSPAESFSIDFDIDFEDAAIGHQSRQLSMHNGTFVHELSDCRTFARRSEVEALQANGLGLGGSLDNAVIVDGDEVLNPGGFRRADECVRHKMLDAVGDLALAGAPIIGAYKGVRAGHGPTNKLLRKLFATPGACEFVYLDRDAEHTLPGAGVNPADLPHAV